jgi:hypothetical protein
MRVAGAIAHAGRRSPGGSFNALKAKKTWRRWIFHRLFILYILRLTDFVHLRMPEQQPPNNQLNIEISEEMAEGQYANLVIITHSHAEFVIDFVNVMPGTPKSRVKSRIILTPQHAKRFMKALTENIVRFEKGNGNIQDLEEVQLPLNFGGPTAQA